MGNEKRNTDRTVHAGGRRAKENPHMTCRSDPALMLKQDLQWKKPYQSPHNLKSAKQHVDNMNFGC